MRKLISIKNKKKELKKKKNKKKELKKKKFDWTNQSQIL